MITSYDFMKMYLSRVELSEDKNNEIVTICKEEFKDVTVSLDNNLQWVISSDCIYKISNTAHCISGLMRIINYK